MEVKKGSKVKIEYEGKLEDGTVFDSSERHGKPLEFEAGEGKVIKGFDKVVVGMKKGEEKELALVIAGMFDDVFTALEKIRIDLDKRGEKVQ